MPVAPLEIQKNLTKQYADVLTPEAISALNTLAPFDAERHALMAARIARRAARARDRRHITFLDPDSLIPRTSISVQDARDGNFVGSAIPADLERQWIQGTGPAARPDAPIEQSIRNVAYALLSGADGWMFDGEDALGQLSTMSLDNQRNLKLAIAGDPMFLEVAEQVAVEMNEWAQGFFGRAIVHDWRQQLGFTTKIFRARGLHLDDRHVRHMDGGGFSASIVDLALYVVNNHRRLAARRCVDRAVPAEDPDRRRGGALERHARRARSALGLPPSARSKSYVLIEQIEACFQLMEIRAALGAHFVGFNTGRWDYINSVADAVAWDPAVHQPEHRRHRDDVRIHAATTRIACAGP